MLKTPPCSNRSARSSGFRSRPKAILARVAKSLHERPLLAAHQDDPLGRITALLADRAPRYAALADWTLDTSDCADSEEAADRLLRLLAIPTPL